MATASVRPGRGDDAELARAVHQVLATLTNVRGDTSAVQLGDRIGLVRWLRTELAAVETLLTGAYGRQAAMEDAAARRPDRAD